MNFRYWGLLVFLFYVLTTNGQVDNRSISDALLLADDEAHIKSIEKANFKLLKSLMVDIDKKKEVFKEIDNLVSLPMDTSTNGFKTKVMEDYNYNSDGFLLKSETQRYGVYSDYNPYSGNTKVEIVYDDQNRVVKKLQYYPVYENDDEFTFQMGEKLEFGYDQFGNTSFEITSVYSSDFGKLDFRTKKVFAYDESNRCIASVSSLQSDDTNSWENKTKREFAYNDLGNLVTSTHYSWNRYGWYSTSKDEMEYDANGYKSLVNMYVRRGERWIKSKMRYYRHFDQDKLYHDAIYQWDKKEEKWKMYKSTEKDFNSKGQEISSLSFLNGEPQSKSFNTYNDEGRKILYDYYYYEHGEWVNSRKIFQGYNRNGKRVFHHLLVWNDEINRLVTQEKIESFYNGEGLEILRHEYGVDKAFKTYLKSKRIVLRDTRKKYEDYQYDLSVLRDTITDDWTVKHMDVNLYNGENLVCQSRYNDRNEDGLLLCNHKVFNHNNPSEGEHSEIIFKKSKEGDGLRLYSRFNTRYIDFNNRQKEVTFVSDDVFAIGVEVKEKRRVAEKSFYLMKNGNWVVYNGLRKLYDKNANLLQAIVYGKD